MAVGGLRVAKCLGSRRCRHREFHVGPGATASIELGMKKEPPRAVEYPPSPRPPQAWDALAKRYHGV